MCRPSPGLRRVYLGEVWGIRRRRGGLIFCWGLPLGVLALAGGVGFSPLEAG